VLLHSVGNLKCSKLLTLRSQLNLPLPSLLRNIEFVLAFSEGNAIHAMGVMRLHGVTTEAVGVIEYAIFIVETVQPLIARRHSDATRRELAMPASR